MRNLFLAVPIVVVAIGGSTACATKKFVRTSVGEVNEKVDSLGPLHRGDPGAHASERNEDRRRRHACTGSGGSGQAGR